MELITDHDAGFGRPQAQDWNPRFVNYARAHGRGPAEQLAHDRQQYVGGSMAGFIIWNSQRLGDARKAIPGAFMAGGALADHPAYDAWLTAWVDSRLGAAMEVLREAVRLFEMGDDRAMGHLLHGRARRLTAAA